MSSSPCRPPATRLVGLIGLAALVCGPAVADDFSVRIAGVSSPALDPGTFSSVVADVENPGSRVQTVTLELVAPPGWVVVSGARTVRIGVLEQRSVPFTVHVPERASDDEPHEFTLVVTAAEGDGSIRYPHALRVTPHQSVELHAVPPAPVVHPGERTRYVLRVENTGNVSDLYSLRVESTPHWNVSLRPPALFLRPGESMDVVVEADVPRHVAPGTLHRLELTATASPLDLGDPARARVALTGVVVAATQRPSRFHRLPLEVTMATGRNRRDEPAHALRLISDGRWGRDRWLLLESDFRTAGPAVARGLGLRRARGRLSGPSWEVSAGDVWSEFSEVVAPTVSGRGGSVRKESARWTAESFVHVASGEKHLPVPTWGARSTVELRPGLQADGGLLGRQSPTAIATDPPRETFLTIGTRWTPTARLELRSEAALSREVIADSTSIGHAGEIQADYRGETFQAKARGTSGAPEFAGRARNERALLAYARTAVTPRATVWTNVDVVRQGAHAAGDPARLTRNVRLAGQFGDPGTEIFLDSRSERLSDGTGEAHARTELFTTWFWRERGPLLLGMSGKGGWTSDERADTRGILWGGAAKAIGRLGAVHTTVTIDRSAEYRLGDLENHTATTVHADVSWAPARWPLALGLDVRSQSGSSPAAVTSASRSVRPRAEWRWSSATRLRLDATLEDGADRGLTEWRLQLVWSGEDALPLLWSPHDATPRGRVFLDVDLDGTFGPGDTPMPGVRLTIDGQTRISGGDGELEFPPAIGASYRIELKPAALPPGLVPARPFPRDLPVAGSLDRFFDVPLVRGGEVSGRVFHDLDRDGHAGTAEPGLPDVRMELVREGRRVATNLTGARGTYSFGKLPPGEYTLRVAAGWMPAGWEATGRPELRVEIAPGGLLRVEPLGLAPRRKPIRKTFDGTSGAR